MRLLVPRVLTADAFAPYGEVIAAAGEFLPINRGATQRYHDLAHIVPGEGGKAIVSIFRSSPVSLPFEIMVMENHPLGSQAFMPLSGRPYVVVVAPKGPLDTNKLEAFAAGPHQGVNFAPGTWHHYNLALGEASDFLVIDRAPLDKENPGTNLEEVALSEPVILSGGS